MVEYPAVPIALRTKPPRDPRVDVLRGLSLWMIFVDHIPNNHLNLATLHNFGFADAAEIFVVLAGFSSFMAYGRAFEREGATGGLRRIALRCLRIYLAQIILLLITVGVVWLWTTHYDQEPTVVAPLIYGGLHAIAKGITLSALPSYLDILPLYIVLLGLFPVIYAVLRINIWLALACSSAIWLVAWFNHGLDLPNIVDPDGNGWYFNPFSWQLLFTAGSALAIHMYQRGGILPRHRWLTAISWCYLAFALLQGGNWKDWGLPNLQLFAMDPPDKSHLSLLRLADIMAILYLVLGSKPMHRLAGSAWMRPFEACGRHSLEVFSLCTVLSLFSRLTFRTFGSDVSMQVLVNASGILLLFSLAFALERVRRPRPKAETPLLREVERAA
jgi:hypothetical protein